jgi:hypothetical protein
MLEGKPGEKVVTRELWIDPWIPKRFLCEYGNRTCAEIETFHDVWYVELYRERRDQANLFAYMVLDASAHKLDRIDSIIRGRDEAGPLGSIPKGMPQLSRLTKIIR